MAIGSLTSCHNVTGLVPFDGVDGLLVRRWYDEYH